MTITFGQTCAASSATTANPTSASSTTTPGSLIVATITNDSGTASYQTSFTDNKTGNTYTRAATASNGGCDHEVWYGVLAAGGAGSGAGHTFSMGFSLAGASNIAWVIQEFLGVWGANPLDQRGPALLAVTTGSSTSPLSAATGTTAAANELVVGSLSHLALTTTATAGASFSNLVKAGLSTNWAIQESRIVAATGTYTASCTLGASRGWGAKALTFQESAAKSFPVFQNIPPRIWSVN